MNETTKINFNNPDGSFNRDKWLDFMNTKIDNIGFYSAWTGHTVKIVNQQSKYIDFYGACICRERMNKFNGWNIKDLTYCYNEATAELNDKRLMTMTRKDGWTQYHCDTQCAESYKNPTRY